MAELRRDIRVSRKVCGPAGKAQERTFQSSLRGLHDFLSSLDRFLWLLHARHEDFTAYFGDFTTLPDRFIALSHRYTAVMAVC